MFPLNHSMGDKKQHISTDHAQRLPAFFVIVKTILNTHVIRVVKYQTGSVKRNFMLRLIYPILFMIPFKKHDIIVDTKL